MSGISEHFFEDSPTSRGAIGNVMFICVLLTNSFQFAKNNTKQGMSKTKRDTAVSEATAEFAKLITDLPKTKPEECFENFQPALMNVCNVTLDESEECEHYVNNGMWDICQSLTDYAPCGPISFTYSTEDYFRHPAFYAGCGFLIGCILALIALLMISLFCSKCRKSKVSKTGTGSGSGTIEAGKGSTDTKNSKNSKNSKDSKNSSDESNNNAKPAVPKSQYIGDEFAGDGGKKSVFIGAKTIQKPVKSVRKGAAEKTVKPGGVNNNNNKKRKNKYGKDVGALTAMEVSMYK